MTRVVHCKKEPYDVYIGRPTIFGNPHRISAKMDRPTVIALYRTYLRERMKRDEKFRNAILSLKGKVIGCWCKPLQCHGDVIVEIVEGWNGEINE